MRFFLKITAVLVFLGFCENIAGAAPLRIVSSFTIPADWVKTVGGSHVAVESLVPPNSDLHAYQPTPSDIRKLREASLIVAIDPVLEKWLADITSDNSFKNKVLYLGKPWLSDQGAHPHDCNENEHSHAHSHDVDPHLWMDVSIVKQMITSLSSRLGQLDPANASGYTQNSTNYISALSGLDAEISTELGRIPASRRVLLTHHENLGRFAERYKFQTLGTIITSTSTEASDPSAGKLSLLIKAARKAKVPVFYDNTANKTLVDTVTKEAALPQPVLLYTDALDVPPNPASTYIGMYRENARRIAEALK
ncbi:MAG: metal ABC transporter substrate-binding protein [Puniceicoccales bacterium]|jgi:zinc/manganese transport system substrate-binding protein|nr:metal ABC transporter substrate-binding protein [Puniceicoccales bacterium]